MEIDHVLFAVADLATAAAEFEDRGLASVGGGRHPGWGTANRIIPLGGSYLELIAVVDAGEAAASPFGRWVLRAPPGRPMGWAVRTDRLEETANRLNLTIRSGSRQTATGGLLGWRTAGTEKAAEDPSLPFFIQWESGTPHPGSTAVDHPAGRLRLTRLEIWGDDDELGRWLGSARLPVVVSAGPRGVARVVLTAQDRDLTLD